MCVCVIAWWCLFQRNDAFRAAQDEEPKMAQSHDVIYNPIITPTAGWDNTKHMSRLVSDIWPPPLRGTPGSQDIPPVPRWGASLLPPTHRSAPQVMGKRREEGADSSGPARLRSAALSEKRPVSLLRAASGAGAASLKAEPPSAPSLASARMEAVSHVTSRTEEKLKRLPIGTGRRKRCRHTGLILFIDLLHTEGVNLF